MSNHGFDYYVDTCRRQSSKKWLSAVFNIKYNVYIYKSIIQINGWKNPS